VYDIAIIGGGPAGLSAAVNARARGKSAAVFTKGPETSALWKAARIDNHLGLSGVTGREMMERFSRHAADAGADITLGSVSGAIPFDGGFSLDFSPAGAGDRRLVSAKKIILCVGAAYGKKIKGEERFLGSGVSYCATCDGALYRGRDVCVVAEDPEAASDARFLAGVCKTVYVVNKIGDTFDAGGLPANVRTIGCDISDVRGAESVESVVIDGKSVDVDCVFFIKPVLPAASLLYGLAANADGSVAANAMMETNIPGVFVCGDARGKPFQLSKAVGDGQIAALNAAKD
jgi:thioredoxin reductase (NADPH)